MKQNEYILAWSVGGERMGGCVVGVRLKYVHIAMHFLVIM